MADEGPWTIDDFARRAGTTVRNVRLYQERGLVPPPERRGRVGLYGPEHLERVRLVLALLARGYPLAAIRELLDAWAERRSLGDVLGFEEALAQPFTPERPRTITAEELLELFPPDPDDDGEVLARAIEIGLLVPEGDDFVAPVPAMVEAGRELIAQGVPPHAALDAAAAVMAAGDRLAATFVAMFQEHVWAPFIEAGAPAEGWPAVTDALSRQHRLWDRAVVPALGAALERHVAETRRQVVDQELQRRAERGASA